MITLALFFGLWLNSFKCPVILVIAAIFADYAWLTAAFNYKRK